MTPWLPCRFPAEAGGAREGALLPSPPPLKKGAGEDSRHSLSIPAPLFVGAGQGGGPADFLQKQGTKAHPHPGPPPLKKGAGEDSRHALSIPAPLLWGRVRVGGLLISCRSRGS